MKNAVYMFILLWYFKLLGTIFKAFATHFQVDPLPHNISIYTLSSRTLDIITVSPPASFKQIAKD